MPSMFNADIRAGFNRRIKNLRPDAQRQWGRMNAPQMVCHLADQLRMALGEIQARSIPGPLRYPLIKQLVIDVLPWPKGRIQGPPEAFTSSPVDWNRDVQTLLRLLEQFGEQGAREKWPPHPNFGRLSGPLWSRLTCRHFDHHLRQFGV
jgi:hypothetical protein